jgi:heme-degrading monooxygenase HmoA
MFLQQVQIDVRPGQEAVFEAGLLEVRQRVFMQPGFRGFDVAQSGEQPATYLVQVRWETLEELTAFVESGLAERAWGPVEAFLVRDPRVDHFIERHELGLGGPGVVTDLAWAKD